MDFQSFLNWQAAAPGRVVEAKITDDGMGNQDVEIWVFQRGYSAGQFVSSVDEITLEAEHEKQEKADLKRLLEKYPMGVE